MLVNRKADYAVRAVLHLSTAQQKVVSTTDIARAVQAPTALVAKALQDLARAGICESVRGIHGGYRLARPAQDIQLLQVLEVIQGPIQVNDCVTEGKGCDLSPDCSVHPVWVEVRAMLERTLRDIDFAQLADPTLPR